MQCLENQETGNGSDIHQKKHEVSSAIFDGKYERLNEQFFKAWQMNFVIFFRSHFFFLKAIQRRSVGQKCPVVVAALPEDSQHSIRVLFAWSEFPGNTSFRCCYCQQMATDKCTETTHQCTETTHQCTETTDKCTVTTDQCTVTTDKCTVTTDQCTVTTDKCTETLASVQRKSLITVI